MHKLMKIELNKISILALGLALIVTFMLFLRHGAFIVFKQGNIDFFSKKILKICSDDEYKRGCYDREIPKLLRKGYMTMEQAFLVTNKIQGVDRSYLYCHVLGHDLADIETRRDTSKWLDVISRCPPVNCNNGCAHGAVMRRFKGSDVLSETQLKAILPDLKIACEPRDNWKPSELEISMCYHSMGHLAMYITDADVDRSLSICSDIGVKPDGRNYYQTCVQGVFMIIFQFLDDEDIALVAKIKPEKDKVDEFCSGYSGLEFTACKVESWPYFSDEIGTPAGLSRFCSFATDDYYKKWCYDDVGLRGGVPLKVLDKEGVEGLVNFCLNFPQDIQERCFPSVATALVQDEPNFITDSIKLCKLSEKYGYSDACYNALLFFSKFSFNQGSDGWKNYCDKFPSKYKDICLSGNVPNGW